MSYVEQHNELRAHFARSWEDTTPVDWPNAKFVPPTNASWARFRILDGASHQLTIGAATNPHRHAGVIIVSIFTVLGKGDATALSLADQAAGIFRNWQGTNITCRQPSIKNLGPDGQGWYQINVEFPFHRDQLI